MKRILMSCVAIVGLCGVGCATTCDTCCSADAEACCGSCGHGEACDHSHKDGESCCGSCSAEVSCEGCEDGKMCAACAAKKDA